jgi:hypothetical protein
MRLLPIVALAAVLFAAGLLAASPPEAFAREAAAAGQSAVPILGVHTRLTDEVEEWKIRRTMQMVREMGATWAVEYFPWTYIEGSKGRYDWVHADQVVDAAADAGVRLIARVDNVPQWARPPGSSDRFADERTIREYADFIFAFVRRYQGRIAHLIIWNEPNTSNEWGFRPVDPEGYTRLLRAAYLRAKEADPAILVLPGAMAPTTERSRDALDDLEFWRRMYAAGAKDAFDVMNIHAYGLRSAPEEAAAPGAINFRRAALIRELMVSNGDGAKRVMITEAGWNDHPRWTKAVGVQQRSDYTVRSIQIAEREWPWLDALCFWTFRLPFPARNYNDNYTFVDQEFRPRPVYEAVRAYVDGR